jgi:hypothetical protein
MFRECGGSGPSSFGVQWIIHRKARLLGLLGASLLMLGGLAIRDRGEFLARCVGNNNAVSACWCTFNALPELPDQYRVVAVSWAHDSSITYAGSVMTLAVSEVASAWRTQLRPLPDWSSKRKATHSLIWSAATAMGWTAAQQAAPVVAAKVAPWLIMAPATYHVGSRFTRARAAMGRHCGGVVDTFMVRVENARLQLERSSAQVSAAARGTTIDLIEAAATTAVTTGTSVWRGLLSLFGL